MTRVVAIIFCSCHRPCKERCHHNCQLPLCFLSFFCCLIFAPKPAAAVIPVPKRFFYNTVLCSVYTRARVRTNSRVHFIKLIRQTKNVFNEMLIQNIKKRNDFNSKLTGSLGQDYINFLEKISCKD